MQIIQKSFTELFANLTGSLFTNLIGVFHKSDRRFFQEVWIGPDNQQRRQHLALFPFFLINQSNFSNVFGISYLCCWFIALTRSSLSTNHVFWHFSIGPETGLWGKVTYCWLFLGLLRFLHSSVTTWNKSPLLHTVLRIWSIKGGASQVRNFFLRNSLSIKGSGTPLREGAKIFFKKIRT